VGLILALVAAGGVYLLSSFGGGGAIGGGPTQTVVIAKGPIALRHTITKDDLDTLKNVSTNVTNVYTNMNDVIGLIAQIQISKGAVISKDMLGKDIGLISAGSAPAYLPLASGYVALTIPTSEQVGVAGHITLGDYVTVVASGQTSMFPTKKAAPTTGTQGSPNVSKTVFTNVRVIGLGPATSNVQPASGATSVGGSAPVGGVTSSLTVEMTQCDAEYLTWFLTTMQVKYTLESFADYLAQPPSAPDPTCQTVDAAHGVTVKQVDARYHFSTLNS
jgi:Flp pilus assembly protein CpaB